MDSASCEVNGKAAHLGRFGIFGAEAHDEWERGTLGYVGGSAEGAPPLLVGWGVRGVLREHSSCSGIVLLTTLVLAWGSPGEDSEPKTRVQDLHWEVQGTRVDEEGGDLRQERQPIKNELLIPWGKFGGTSKTPYLRFLLKSEGAGIVIPQYTS